MFARRLWSAAALSLALIACARPCDARGPAGDWGVAPHPPLEGAVAVYDSLRDRLVLVTGTIGHDWNRRVYVLSPSDSAGLVPLAVTGDAPPVRAGAAGVYDAQGDRLVLFGGRDSAGTSLADVWALSLSGVPHWSPLTPSGTPPAARAYHVAVFDPGRRRMLVHGGIGPGARSDVWALGLDGSPAWSAITPSGTPPSARYMHMAIWDPLRDRMVLFGGIASGNGFCPYSNEFWVLDCSGTPAWSALPVTPAPPPGWSAGLCLRDPVRDQMVVFGGSTGCGNSSGMAATNQTWALQLATAEWGRIFTGATVPDARSGAMGAYDARRDAVLFVGGSVGRDAWTMPLATSLWRRVSAPIPGPGERAFALTVVDPRRDRLFVFGGSLGALDLGGTWMFRRAPRPEWTKLTLPNAPALAFRCDGFYDPVRDRIVVVTGGENPSGSGMVPNQVWGLSLGDTMRWSRIEPIGAGPATTVDPRVVYDAEADALVFASGQSGDPGLDVWTLPLGAPALWTKLATIGVPPILGDLYTVTYDPPRHRLVTYSGIATDPIAHALGLSAPYEWTTLAATGAGPGVRRGHAMTYDPIADRMVLFGGVPQGGEAGRDSWELSLGDTVEWRRLDPSGDTPSGRTYSCVAYDPVRDAMVLFGGTYAYPVDDARTLAWSRGVRLTVLPESDVSWSDGHVLASWTWRNPLPVSRRFVVTYSNDRHWISYALTTPVAVAGGAEARTSCAFAVPDTAAPGSNTLRLRVELLGAPGVGDEGALLAWPGSLPTGVEPAAAVASPGSVTLDWPGRSGDTRVLEVVRRDAEGTWTVLGLAEEGAGGSRHYVDGTAEPGATYRYALRSAGVTSFAWEGLTDVTVPAAPRLALAPAANPATDGVALWLTLSRRGAYEIAFVDVSGRLVAREHLSASQPGRTLVRFPSVNRPGIYWARLTQQGVSVTAKVALLR